MPRNENDEDYFEVTPDDWDDDGSEDDESDEDDAPSYSRYSDPDGYDRNGAYDGFQVTSDAEGGL